MLFLRRKKKKKQSRGDGEGPVDLEDRQWRIVSDSQRSSEQHIISSLFRCLDASLPKSWQDYRAAFADSFEQILRREVLPLHKEIFEREQARVRSEVNYRELNTRHIDLSKYCTSIEVKLDQEVAARQKAYEDWYNDVAALKSDLAAVQYDRAAEVEQFLIYQEIKEKELEDTRKAELDEAELRHSQHLSRVNKEHKRKYKGLENTTKTRIDELESSLRETQEMYEKVVKDIRAEYDRKVKNLEAELWGMSATLVAQENKYLAPNMNIEINRLDDGDAKARFTELIQMVNDLANLQWKPEQDTWTEELMDRIGVNKGKQRMMRKRILQDTIWTHLHQWVFCSPFRAFGDEGHVLEEQWSQAYEETTDDPRLHVGTYSWPKPDIETERWRYVTIKECRVALMQECSKFDPRGRVKKDFISNSTALTSELVASLRDIVLWDDAHRTSVMELTRKATHVWLEFAVQRYRVLISINGAKLMPARAKARRFAAGSLELVVLPELGRYGNAKGFELNKYATISDCTSEMYGISSV